jgi:hypothetical protein
MNATPAYFAKYLSGSNSEIAVSLLGEAPNIEAVADEALAAANSFKLGRKGTDKQKAFARILLERYVTASWGVAKTLGNITDGASAWLAAQGLPSEVPALIDRIKSATIHGTVEEHLLEAHIKRALRARNRR